MVRSAIEMAYIARARGGQLLERFKAFLGCQHLKTSRAVFRCRTPALGGLRDMWGDRP
jgi:hypothetical protein